MIISIGADHSGFELKTQIISYLEKAGHRVNDMGTYNNELCDYPDIAPLVCEQILEGRADRGILICGTGIGMSIIANRNLGIRAAVCNTEYMVKKAREHNDANILALGARTLDAESAFKLIDIFLSEDFEGGRHATRLNKFN